MKRQRILFIDRDGTLIEEPYDEQVDSFSKLKFTKGVFKNLGFIRSNLDFLFVMVSNQDGLGTESFPEETFWPVHNFILQTLKGENIIFDDSITQETISQLTLTINGAVQDDISLQSGANTISIKPAYEYLGDNYHPYNYQIDLNFYEFDEFDGIVF